MKLTSAQVERTLGQFEARAIPGHLVTGDRAAARRPIAVLL
jgi:hypothetical protein